MRVCIYKNVKCRAVIQTELQRLLSTIYVRRSAMRFATYLAIVFVVFDFVNAVPFPQFDDGGREGLAARDTAYYGFPLFWYRRPIYDSDDDIVNGGQVLDGRRRSSTVSYVNVGAGWGR
ncbi:PREDICTED: uncharacterized protein LOC105568551 isoform X3 [Vollenhovia emeryi]|uniref:uncharacterized protein LOC105568551 isoform X3 n=1 Tax=Vollenhovia emeryi TaxID=411798 RepID=UPI0005F51953|nr:PREDICTED: uncharacterized protein LOC105568551 isoform X3 [Vollenhovia emeryi]